MGGSVGGTPSGLTLVLGSELSCMVDVPALGRRISMHLLAYGFDPEEPQLAAERLRMRDARVDRVDEVAADAARRRLRPVVGAACAAGRSRAAVGRPHFASLLVEAGLAPSFEAAFGPEWAGGRYRVPRRAGT